MARAVKEWLDVFSTQNIQIWCEDPETNTEKFAGVSSKTYLTYRILLKQIGRDVVGVRHRYSEFETLRNQLKDRYAPMGINVVALPPKNSIKFMMSATSMKSDDTIVKERTAGLTMFCESIVSSPWLSNDKLWKDFLKPSMTKSDTDAPNVGETQLIATLAQLEIPYKSTLIQRMEDIKEEVNHIEKAVKVLLEKAKSMQAAERTLQTCIENVAVAAETWAAEDRTHVRSLTGYAFDENESIVGSGEMTHSTLSALGNLCKAKANTMREVPDITGLTLVVALEHELSIAESIREIIKVHEEILQSIDSLSSKLNKTETSKAANKHEVAADLRRQLDEKQLCLNAFYKGVIYFTLPSVARVRANTLRKLASGFVTANLTSSYSLQQACLSFYSSLNIAPALAIVDVCRSLELLSLKPLDHFPTDDLPPSNAVAPAHNMSGLINDALLDRAYALGAGKLASTTYSHNNNASVSSDDAAGGGVGTTSQKGSPVAVNPLTRRGSAVTSHIAAAKSVEIDRATSSELPEASPAASESVAPPATPVVNEKTKSLLDGLTTSNEAIKARAADSGIWGDEDVI